MTTLDDIRQRRGMTRDIAAACGITPGAVSQWAEVPAHHVLTVAKLTGLHPHTLAPGLYPADMVWKGETVCK